MFGTVHTKSQRDLPRRSMMSTALRKALTERARVGAQQQRPELRDQGRRFLSDLLPGAGVAAASVR